MTKLKSSNCDKSQIVTKLKLWQNSNCDKGQVLTKIKLWQKSNCEEKKLKKSMWQNSNCDKTQELKLRQKSKTHILTKLEIWQMSIYEEKTFKGSFSKIILTPWQPMWCLLGRVLPFLQRFVGLGGQRKYGVWQFSNYFLEWHM